MIESEEFVYRIPGSMAGTRPGAHRGSSLGSGMNFAGHARLFDQPDPRRLDLRASISDVRGEWLVRTYSQPASITVHVLVDMSASMYFGQPGKIQVATQFLHSLGISAHAYGDALSLLPFDEQFREDIYIPPRRGRAVGSLMVDTILNAIPTTRMPRKTKVQKPEISAFETTVNQIEGTTGLVFLLSDFHWALDKIDSILDKLSSATLVPIVIWDAAEVVPPAAGQLLFARDLKNQRRRRQLWISERKREQWLNSVQKQRQNLIDLFARRNSTPFFLETEFSAERLSRYFMEQAS